MAPLTATILAAETLAVVCVSRGGASCSGPSCLGASRTTMREKLTDLATAATTRTTSTYVTVAQPRSKVLWICKTGTLGFLVGGNWACFNVNFSPFCLKPFKTQ